MAAPTLVSYTEVAGSDHGAWDSTGTPRSTASITWLANDILVAIVGVADGSMTIGTPTGTGLTFTSVFGTQIGTTSSNCAAQIYTASPTSGGSSAVAGSITGSFPNWGMAVWVWRGSTGVGAHAGNISAETLNLVRTGNNSVVCGAVFDWNATATTGYGWTPSVTTGHDREHGLDTSQYGYYVADWGDQGASGTTAYGITGITGGPFTNVSVEIFGGASGTDATVTFPQSIQIHP